MIDVVRHTIGDSGAIPQAPARRSVGSQRVGAAKARHVCILRPIPHFRPTLRKTFIDSLPATLVMLRASLHPASLIKADSEMNRLKEIYELYRRIHALAGNAGIAGLVQIAHMAAALEALLKELYEKPKNINTSTMRTVAATVDFLGVLFERGTLPERQEVPSANILVVDDEAISRRAITVHALEKAQL